MHRKLAALLFGLMPLVAPLASAKAESAAIQGSVNPEQVELVYVDRVDGTFAAAPATMNQQGNSYRPHVLPVLVGSTVEFKSSDPELHNVFARGADHHVLFNRAVLPHQQMSNAFAKPGIVKLTCNVHKGMLAFIAVLQNPYWSTPDKSGHWKISGLPAGHYELRVWGESLDEATLAKTFPVDVTAGGPPQTLKLAAN